MMPDLPGGPLVQAVGWALLHLVWLGTVVAALLALVLAVLPGRSHLRYVLSCLALAAIVALGVGAGIGSWRAAMAPASAAQSGAGAAPVAATLAAPAAVAAAAGARIPAALGWVDAAEHALPLVVTLWLSGVLLFSVRLLIEWLRIRRMLDRHAAAAPAPWPAVASRLRRALGLRHVVRVLESAAVDVPSVVGLLRPAILIPTSALTGLTPAQLEMILAHELAHVRRHDFLVNLLQTVVETLLFYHPAVWWVSRQIRAERENCCDDLAVAACGDRLQYARALLRLEELRAQRFALAMSADGGSLVARVRRIVARSPRTPGSAVRAAGSLAVPLFLLLAVALPAVSSMRRTPRAIPAHPAATHAGPGARRPESLAAAATPDEAEDGAEGAQASPRVRSSEPATGAEVASPGEDTPDASSASDETPNSQAQDADGFSDAADDKPSLDDLIALRTQGVTPAYIREMRSLLGGVALQEIAGLKAVGVTPEYVREMRRAGLAVETAGEASGLAALGVTREFIREMRSIGLEVTSAGEAQGLKAVGVSAAYVRALRARGIDMRAEEAQGLAAVGVTPEYVDGLREAGLEITDAGALQSLRALGITPAFVRRLARAGYRDLDVDRLQQLAAAGVNGDFVRQMSRFRAR